MNLYKMELYKTLRRPIVRVTGLIMALLLGFYFYALGDGERSAVGDAEPVFGYRAVRQDREIAEAFEGILTDEKLQQIVDMYGFPSRTRTDYGGWWDGNFLTEFVTDYFSDGYLRSWDNYKPAEHLIPIAESSFYHFIEGEELYFGYYKGWENYIDFMQFAGYVLIVWLVVVLSPLFSQELDTGMYPLIFTTENGRSRDVGAKLAAAFTVTLACFLTAAGLSFIGCWRIYGLGGARTLVCFTEADWLSSCSDLTVAQFTLVYLAVYVVALLMTCGFCVFASAGAKTNFSSLLTAGGILIAPFVLRLFGVSWLLCDSQPIFLIWPMALLESTKVVPYWLYLCTGVALTAACTTAGRKRWKEVRE